MSIAEEVDYGDNSTSCLDPRTLLEIDLIKFAGSIREKPQWWIKVQDKALTDKYASQLIHALIIIL
jgi:hypothetical protein